MVRVVFLLSAQSLPFDVFDLVFDLGVYSIHFSSKEKID